jgi:hypothetical protein
MAREEWLNRPGAEGVVLDTGEGVGALVICTSIELLGREVEVSREGARASRTHAVVRERRAGGSSTPAAVFPSLDEGDYAVRRAEGGLADRVRITGGRVTEIDWRGW